MRHSPIELIYADSFRPSMAGDVSAAHGVAYGFSALAAAEIRFRHCKASPPRR